MSRDSENELRMIDDRHVESSSKKAVSNQLSDDLVSENKTEIEKMKKEIGEVSKKIFYQKNNREIQVQNANKHFDYMNKNKNVLILTKQY